MYIANGGASLDPHALPITLKKGLYVHHAGNGELPLYFQQYLPGAYAELILSKTDTIWDGLNQFQKLARLSEAFGDQHALQLNAHLDQSNYPVHSIDDLQQIVATMRNLQISKKPQPLKKDIFIAVCSMSGNKPKLDYADPASGNRYTARINSSTAFAESRMRATMHDLERLAGIDSVSTSIKLLPDGNEITLQGNYKHEFLEHDQQQYLLKFNSVPFQSLCDSPSSSKMTFNQAAEIIRKYSADLEADMQQLLLRALFSARINHVSNDVSQLVLIDIGINEWRLAPTINTLPDPAHERPFDTPFGNYETTRQHFLPDEEFAIRFAGQLGLPEKMAVVASAQIDTAIRSLPKIIESHGLSSSDIATLDRAVNGISIVSPPAPGSTNINAPTM